MSSLLLPFFKGAIAGALIAMPFGPIDLICVQNALVYGRRYGVLSGIGCAAADAIYGAVASLGVAAAITYMTSYRYWLQLIGGLIIIIVGLHIFLTKIKQKSPTIATADKFRLFCTTFIITLANPTTLLAYIGIFAALSVTPGEYRPLSIGLITIGVFAGSTLWWVLLSFGATLFREKISPAALQWANRIVGVLLIAVGLCLFAYTLLRL